MTPTATPTLRALYDVPAPAKLNLFLHVVGRRADGYHLLQSVFMLIDWADTLHFERRDDGRLRRQDLNSAAPALPEHDLVLRAATALQQATGCTLGADMALDKQLPQEAGLGGGSSDAATTLLALNRLWQLHLPLSALMQIGARLGADVPFFLGGQHAWVEGIGEQLQPLTLPPGRFLVIKPASGVSTPQLFSAPDLQRNTKPVRIEDFVAGTETHPAWPTCNAGGFGRNDLQPVAQALCPDITRVLQWLQARSLHGRMTGSGSAVFAPLTQDADLHDLPPGWTARHCNNLKEHPLNGWR